MKTEIFRDIKTNFDNNQKSVTDLINFDRILLDFCIAQLQGLDGRLKSNIGFLTTNAIYFPTMTIDALKNIKQNDSMRIQYEYIFNQCVVLSVSYFTSTVHSVFKKAINHACCCCPDLLSASNEDIKITFDELKQHRFDLTDSLGDLIIKKKDLSFQDMQSIQRSFKSFLNINIARDKDINNIILGQASRHSIVHASAVADEKFIHQIRDCNDRDILTDIQENDQIKFSPEAIGILQKSMETYVSKLIDLIEEKIFVDGPTVTNEMETQPEE